MRGRKDGLGGLKAGLYDLGWDTKNSAFRGILIHMFSAMVSGAMAGPLGVR